MSSSPPTTPPSPLIGTRGPGSRTATPSGPPRSAPPPALVPGARRQRRWSLALLAVLITLGSALGFVVLWMNAGGREPVLVMKNGVTAGQIIQDDDLTVVRIAADPGVRLLSSKARDDVVGKAAAVDLLPGQALVKDAIGEVSGLAPGSTELAIPVAKEVMPHELQTGDHVTLYSAIDDPETGQAEAQEIGAGRISSVSDEDDSGGDFSVSVIVDDGIVADVVTAISAEKIYLTKTSG
jgi:hypothetical protein